MSGAIDFDGINTAARQQLRTLLPRWLPNGRFSGREYAALNPTRADASIGSFTINADTGEWLDGATDDRGGDPISLFKYLHGYPSQGEAAKALGDQVGVATVATVAGDTFRNENRAGGWRPMLPLPADAPKVDAFALRFAPPGLALANTYHYEDREGRVLGYVARYERRGNGMSAAKEFRPIVYAEGPGGRREWRCMGFPAPRPLYGLTRLAQMPDARVLVVEGEKTCDAAARMFPDWVVVTSPNGSKAARKADWAPLAKRDVVVLPDADDSGAQYAVDVIEMATAAGAVSVRIAKLPAGLPEGWDVADPSPVGIDLKAVIEGAPARPKDAPLPLFPPLPSAEPYPTEQLGPVLSRAATAIARKVQIGEAMAAQSVLAAAALAAQAHADVRLPYGQVRPLSLFFVTIAGSGDRKSTADNEALWPVARREKALREDHARDMQTWRVATAVWTAERKKIEADRKIDKDGRRQQLEQLGPEPDRPLAPFLTTGDLTMEGLLKGWPDAHAALGIFTAEAGQFTAGHAMGEDSRLKTAAILSEAWDGKPLKRIRALDGATILPGRRLACHLMVQPDAAASFLGNAVLRDQGLLSRMLVAAPTSLAGSRMYRDVDSADDAAIRAYGARVLSILEHPAATADSRNELTPRVIGLSAGAMAAWRTYFDHVERQCADELRPVIDFAAKIAEHAARMAAVMTIVEDIRANEISAATMTDALALADWYLMEAVRLAAAGRRDPKLVLAAELLDWLQEWRAKHDGEREIIFRELLQLARPRVLRTKDGAEGAIATLIAHGWLIELPGKPRRFQIVDGEA